MAFTGSATITHVADNLVCITGLSLGIGAAGTIGLRSGGAGEIDLDVNWDRYVNGRGQQVELDKSVQVDIEYADAAAATTEPVAVVKTGDGPTDFLATLTNRDAAVSGAIVIYVRYH